MPEIGGYKEQEELSGTQLFAKLKYDWSHQKSDVVNRFERGVPKCIPGWSNMSCFTRLDVFVYVVSHKGMAKSHLSNLEIEQLADEPDGPRLKRCGLKQQFTVGGRASLSPPSTSIKPVTLCIYTMDEGSVCSDLVFNSGRLTTTEQILDRVLQELELPSGNRNIFSLWLKSKHLQLQLKPYHLPCKLFKRWKDLLSQYTCATYEEVCADLPILSFQRHAFLSLSDEKKLLNQVTYNQTTISLLFHEAVCNVTSGIYPMTREELHTLAGIQAAIELHVTSSTELDVHRFYPSSVFSDSRWFSLFSRKSVTLKHVQNEIERATRAAIAESDDPNQLKIIYLKKCWRQNYYGSVMFRGQIKKPFKAVHWLSYSDRQIVVAINMECVHILSAGSPPEILLYLPLVQLNWQFQPCEDEGENFYSSLWLEYSTLVSDGEEDKKVIKLLQIFSRQAPMMDAMLGKCITDKEQRPEHLDNLSQGTPKVKHVCQEHKLECEIFCEDGTPLTLSKTKSKSKAAHVSSTSPILTEGDAATVGQSSAPTKEEYPLQETKSFPNTELESSSSKQQLTT